MGKRKWILAVSLALVLAVVGLAGCGPGDTVAGASVSGGIETLNISSQQQGIWVSGTGKVSVTPDILLLTLGVEAQETSVSEAQTEAAEAMDKVNTALQDNGVADKDIQTQYFSIRQVTRWDRDTEQEVVIGYRVTNMVTAKIRDVNKAGSIIDAVVIAGGDLIRINNIDFSVDEPSPYYEQARGKAVADAKAKAEQLAKSAGVRLGAPTYISEGSFASPVVPTPRVAYAMEEAFVGGGTPISPGEMEISLIVQVVYAIR